MHFMHTDPMLHHYCQSVTKGSLQNVIDMYRLLQLDVVYQPPNSNSWIMVGQPQLNFAIQIIEVTDAPITDLEKKIQSHIGFISKNPSETIKMMRKWATDNNLRFRDGQWSDKELYFDLPDVFIQFVVEVMHTSIVQS